MNLLYTIFDLALKQPEAPAFISPDKEINYKELWQQSEQVANFILAKNLTKSSPIMVYGHMEPEMIVSFLGSIKSGHPYIPVDTSIPMERIERISKSSQAELLINVSGMPFQLENSF